MTLRIPSSGEAWGMWHSFQPWRAMSLIATLLASAPVRADHKETYTLLGYQAGVSHYMLPATGSGSTISYGGALDFTAYYGLSNTLHVGGRVRATATSDVHISGA